MGCLKIIVRRVAEAGDEVIIREAMEGQVGGHLEVIRREAKNV
jgi:hypothetical protein